MRAPHFEISAAVVRQLGEELVSDEVTALVELVKNAYDADASYVHVAVNTTEPLSVPGTNFSHETGYITIDDDGMGMNREDIESGWLVISLSAKRSMKASGAKTPRGRVPLGDKGLGRLSTQKLGRNLEMFTRREGETETLHVSFTWSDFRDDQSLSDVPVHIGPAKRDRDKGTLLAITGLRTPEVWQGAAIGQLVSDLSQIISPFPEGRAFLVTLSVDGRAIDLASVSERIRSAAVGRFRIDYSGQHLSLTGKVRLAKFRGNKGEDADAYDRLLVSDGGASFFRYLQSKKPIVATSLSSEPGYFMEFTHGVDLRALGEVEGDPQSPNFPADPGPFRAEIDEFLLRPDETTAKLSGLTQASDIQKMVKQHAGIKVFRDGFAVRPYGINGEDWLRLSQGQTSASSWYGLRPHNVIGFVAISEAYNSQLREKTDREGFVANAYSQNFRRLMNHAVETIANFYEWARRNYNTYKAEQSAKGEGFGQSREVLASAEDVAKRLSAYGHRAARMRNEAAATQKKVSEIAKRIDDTPVLSTAAERELSDLLKEARSAIDGSIRLYDEMSASAADVEKLQRIVAGLHPRLEVLSDQLQDFSELAGLGLLAEALSHEVENQTDRLLQKASSSLSKARRSSPLNTDLLVFAGEVATAATALRRQISHLSPSLRYQRDKIDSFNVSDLISDIANHFSERWQAAGVAILVECTADFRIRTNRGRLIQVIDNLLLNSEYWLEHSHSATRVVTVEILSPRILIWDSGLGIDQSVEDALFEPFVTLKPRDVGRGLGLFISAQILESMGCSISLLGDRNAQGRRYIFALDLGGIVDG